MEVDGVDRSGTILLHEAASLGHLEVLRLLLGRGADAATEGSQGIQAVHLAAQFGHLPVMRHLVEKAEAEEMKEYENFPRAHGPTCRTVTTFQGLMAQRVDKFENRMDRWE